jgi:glutamate/tyrosine decarboxylase-like PLP-dependent enzyme
MHGNASTPYSCRYGGAESIPKFALPKQGIPSNAAYQLIHDELDFDGRPNLNVASFVSTYMVSCQCQLLLITRNLRLYGPIEGFAHRFRTN